MEPEEAGKVKKLGIKSFRGLESLFVPKPKEAIVAVNNSEIVAAVIVKFMTDKNNQKVGYVDFAFVDRAYHNQGIGGQIYKEAIAYLWEQGCSFVTTLVKDDNAGSWSLFLKNGFARVGLYHVLTHLGLKGFLNQLIHTALGWAHGMDFYMAEQRQTAGQRDKSTLSHIMEYLLVNLLLSLLMALYMEITDTAVFAGAFLTVLAVSVFAGYIGTLFNRRKWKFRFIKSGFFTSVVILLIGGVFPMIGSWYPEEYEKTEEFKKDLGVSAWAAWLGVILSAAVSFAPGLDYPFFRYLYTISSVLLFYRILAVYPFSGFGGSRVFNWNKIIYGFTAAVSAVIIFSGGTI